MQSVKERQFDELSAMYHLLNDRSRRHMRVTGKEHLSRPSIIPKTLPMASQSERKSSITTGTGAWRVVANDCCYSNVTNPLRCRSDGCGFSVFAVIHVICQ